MARLDLPDPRRDEDGAPGALPSVDFRARQRLALREERLRVLYQAAIEQGMVADLTNHVVRREMHLAEVAA